MITVHRATQRLSDITALVAVRSPETFGTVMRVTEDEARA